MFKENEEIDLNKLTDEQIEEDTTEYDIMNRCVDVMYDEDLLTSKELAEVNAIFEANRDEESEADKERLCNILNDAYKRNAYSFEIRKVLYIWGPGGGWPCCDVVYKGITLEDFCDMEFEGIAYRFGSVTILKIYND